MDDVDASMATVPSRTGDGRPIRPPVAMPASGFGGSGPHCGHTPSCHRYVGAALEGAVSAGFWESVFLWPASGSRSSCGRLLGVGPPVASFLESAILWLSSGGFLGPGRLLVVGL